MKRAANTSTSAASASGDIDPSTDRGREGGENPGALNHQADGAEHSFPVTLNQMLNENEVEGNTGIISWQPHGRSFRVVDKDRLASELLPRWFRQTRFASFQRQLNLYGFQRISTGPDKGSYYHAMFLRGHLELTMKMKRVRIKGQGGRKPSTPDTEPNLYLLPYVPPATRDTATSARTFDAVCTVPPRVVAAPAASFAAAIPAAGIDTLDHAIDLARRSVVPPVPPTFGAAIDPAQALLLLEAQDALRQRSLFQQLIAQQEQQRREVLLFQLLAQNPAPNVGVLAGSQGIPLPPVDPNLTSADLLAVAILRQRQEAEEAEALRRQFQRR